MKIVRLIVGILLILIGSFTNAGFNFSVEAERVGIPIAVVPFSWQGADKPEHTVSDIVTMDLTRSGRFLVIPKKNHLSSPHTNEQVVFKDWRNAKAEALVIGTVRQTQDGRYEVTFRLYDVFRQQQVTGYRYTVEAKVLRRVAHQVADIIYEKLTGERGAFNTRIAYVMREDTASGPIFKLQVADSDGHNSHTIVKSKEPIMSPAWSPDARRLAYVSFEGKRPKVYIQVVADGRRESIADTSGINGAPAWSPDGRRVALASSKDGNPEIYILDLDTRRLKRLTNNRAIDTEPTWSPGGGEIVFTSDRSGERQIYRIKTDGTNLERLTFKGTSNSQASYSPTGEMIALVTELQSKRHIGVLRLKDKTLQVVSKTPLDKTPRFSPNGRMILYATTVNRRGVLVAISSDGRARQLFKLEEGDIAEPAWSPWRLR